ncbi:MAG TPA: alpha/beta hydrolase [Planctomycetota bacterium]|nr:alpha/beta hydrolase [Planctomycetota bacterium]
MKVPAAFLLGLVVAAGALHFWPEVQSAAPVAAPDAKPEAAPVAPSGATPAEAPAAAKAAQPPRAPVVAVGSRITWNVPFVEHATEQQTLDIYTPEKASDAPVVVYVHRGEWAKGDKSEVSYKPKLLNERGIVLVSVNYRLSDVAKHPAQVNDVAAALRWVHDHIADYGGSPNRIVLMGHSAGCHIVSMVGLDPRPLAGVGMSPSDLRGVVCWSGGAYDLPAKIAEAGMYKPYVEKNFGTDQAGLEDASPIHHVQEAAAAVHYVFVSAGEGKLPSRLLSERMADEIRKAGGHADAVTLEGKTHFTADYECGLPGDPIDSGAMLVKIVEDATKQTSN